MPLPIFIRVSLKRQLGVNPVVQLLEYYMSNPHLGPNSTYTNIKLELILKQTVLLDFESGNALNLFLSCWMNSKIASTVEGGQGKVEP